MATSAKDSAVHGPGHLALAPEHTDVAPEDDAVSNCRFKDLKDATLDEIKSYAPCGFKFMRGTRFPHLKGHIIPESMSSGSRSAQKVYFKDGRMAEADDSSSDEISEKHEDTAGKRKCNDESSDDEKTEEPPLSEEVQQPAKLARTACGMVPGVDWDGNAQCFCPDCLGYLDSQQSQDPVAHSQDGAAEEA